jgi:hypothetical protein
MQHDPTQQAAHPGPEQAFDQLNPELAWITQISDPTAARQLRRDAEDIRTRGYRVRIAEDDENDLPQGLVLRTGLVADRAAHAHQRAAWRARAQTEAAFTRLNPDFGALADSRDPAGHQAAQQREAALALGTRVAVATTRENDPNPVLEIAGQDYRAADAAREARTWPPAPASWFATPHAWAAVPQAEHDWGWAR